MTVKLPLQIPLTNFFLSSSSTKFFQHHKFIWMASQSYFDYPTAASTDYPVPLSPPLPELSKEIEPHRALTASSKSALFTLERSHVIFEDEWLIAVNKPQGIYCESILSSLPDLLNDSGIAPKWEKITIKSGHGRSKYGAWRVYAASDAGRKLPGGSLVKDMETSFEVLSVNGLECFKQVSDLQKDEAVVVVQEQSVIGCDLKKDEILVRASPRSGRTHQIRLHCQYLGIPIRGDVRYEGVYEWKGSKYDGHDLHAESLSFDHPVTGKPILLQAPLPSWAIQPLRSQIK
ncbi:RNA pseudouridine synthase 1 isoform X2 [Capsicum annuum]|uniref:RNA pseudouridine synthase 1 isoform X2 n=1 Tax=Capsicum annuum TaxID=4072 RepID=UPI001FB081E8|nr:RNA pseudouridine synthase 1 isoform X2 [Capsicum annuum]XP_047250705.1 RNA pseudouridine synthase 1 isoform X2 [Capsicum annuum]